METVKRTIRITTKQSILEDLPPAQEGFPMRKWSIEVHALGPDGSELPAVMFDKATYKLHPTFVNPTRVVKTPPFLIEEQGWGEFDLSVTLHTVGGGDHVLAHDLNFSKNVYIVDHEITFPTTRPALLSLLAQSGSVPEVATAPVAGNPASSKAPEAAHGEKRPVENDEKPRAKKLKVVEKGSIDLEKLALGLEKLSEEDVLGIVQLVIDNKTTDMYIKNDADQGEFHMDLYTIPDRLLKSMWDYVKKRVDSL